MTDPIATYGLAHVALNVADPHASFRFYEEVIGARALVTTDDVIEFGTPGAHDVITLRRAEGPVSGATGDLVHFGFRLVVEDDPDEVAAMVEEAGGTILGKGRFSNGSPFVFARDLDGYEIEFWHEPDPPWRTP